MTPASVPEASPESQHPVWPTLDFFDAHYEECANGGFACLGVGPAWDTWYDEHSLGHVSATWEMIFESSWLRGFQPWMHRGHEGVLHGETHVFDTTFLPQAMTAPERIGRHEQWGNFVHFNYVVCTYRRFQKARGPIEDEYFRILLLRLLINAMEPGHVPYDVPSLKELARGMTDPSARVTYQSEDTADHYGEFRAKLQQLLNSCVLTDPQRERIAAGVCSFDDAFARTSALLL